MPRDLNVLALLKGDEVFVYVFEDGGYDALLEVLYDHAGEPDMGLSWLDVSVLSRRAWDQIQLTE